MWNGTCVFSCIPNQPIKRGEIYTHILRVRISPFLTPFAIPTKVRRRSQRYKRPTLPISFNFREVTTSKRRQNYRFDRELDVSHSCQVSLNDVTSLPLWLCRPHTTVPCSDSHPNTCCAQAMRKMSVKMHDTMTLFLISILPSQWRR